MTEKQKSEIVELRAKGMTYGDISDKLGVSINTVKSFYSKLKNPQKLLAIEVESVNFTEKILKQKRGVTFRHFRCLRYRRWR